MKFRRLLACLGLLSLVLHFPSSQIALADGGLRPTWGTGGVACASGGFGRDIELTSDGKIYTAGYYDIGFQMVINRTLPDGTADPAFGSGGTKVLNELASAPFSFTQSRLEDLIVMSDGDIVAVGFGTVSSQQDIIIVRLDSTGALDTSFDLDGVLVIAQSIYDDQVFSGVELSDGDIVVAGYSAPTGTANDLFAARINADGSFDNSFDGDGRLVLDVLNNDEYTDIALRSDGNLLLSGTSSAKPAVVALTPTGALDTSFNSDGKAVVNPGFSASAEAIALQSDGKIVLAGTGDNGTLYTNFIIRLTSNGDLDTSFNSTGYRFLGIGTPGYSESLHDVVVQPDGKISTVGYVREVTLPNYQQSILYRVTSTGAIDTTLNNASTAGYVAFGALGGDDEAFAVAIKSSGELFASTITWTGSGRCVGIAKFETTLAPTSWDDGSFATATKNVVYSDSIAVNFGVSATYSLSNGSLPTGITLGSNGIFSGTPTASGAYPITITATADAGTLELVSTFTVNASPSSSDSTITPTATVGISYSDAVSANGFPAPTYAVTSGSLPNGLTLNATTGGISGTPTLGGVFTFTITASNSSGSPLLIGPKTMTVGSAPSWIDSQVSTSAVVGISYNDAFVASGFPAPTYALDSGTLPPGINLNTSTGALIGSAPLIAGTYSFVIRATNPSGSITINSSIIVSPNAAFTTVTPARIADTRNNTGGVGTTKIGNGAQGGTPLTFHILGTGNIPTTGVAAVSLNVTAVATQVGDEGGYVSVYPCLSGQPNVSNLNFTNGQTIPNAVIVPVDSDGNICAYVYGKAHLIIDVNGWFR